MIVCFSATYWVERKIITKVLKKTFKALFLYLITTFVCQFLSLLHFINNLLYKSRFTYEEFLIYDLNLLIFHFHNVNNCNVSVIIVKVPLLLIMKIMKVKVKNVKL